MGFKSRVSFLVCFFILTYASTTYESNTKGNRVEDGPANDDCADQEADVNPNFSDNQVEKDQPGSGSNLSFTFSQGVDYNGSFLNQPKHKNKRQKCKKSLKHKRCKKTQNTKWPSARSFKKRKNRREFRRSEKRTRKLKTKKPRSQRQISPGSMKRRTNKKQVHPLLKVISKRGQYRSVNHVFIGNCLYNSEAY